MVREQWFITDEYRALSVSILQENLAPLRARIGISQEEISNVIGVTRQTYYAIESGKREMPWSTYLALIFFFDSIKSTSEMIRELRIYPIDLIMRFNKDVTLQQLEEMQ